MNNTRLGLARIGAPFLLWGIFGLAGLFPDVGKLQASVEAGDWPLVLAGRPLHFATIIIGGSLVCFCLALFAGLLYSEVNRGT